MGGPGGGGSGGAGGGKNGTAGPGTIEGQWKWGGCDDNIDFGSNKSVDFMDVTYAGASNRTDPKTLILRHNNEAGRIVSCVIINTTIIIIRKYLAFLQTKSAKE